LHIGALSGFRLSPERQFEVTYFSDFEMTTVAQLQDRIQSAVANKTPLRVRAGGTKDFYGEALQGEVLDVSALRGIIDYEPSELVITAYAGTPLAQVEAALDTQGQMLAFEPPSFSGATLGGTIASGIAGPRAGYAGRTRDFVLGAKLIDGKGQHLAFGGQVMKNVAGYDVSRLLAGSLGILGVITQVSLKVLPKPFAQQTLQFALSEADAIAKLNDWAGQPLPLSASAWRGGALHLRLSGAQAAVDAAHKKLGGDVLDAGQAHTFWAGFRELRDPFFAQAGSLIRILVPSATPPLQLRGETLIEWGGGVRWFAGGDLTAARKAAAQAGGHAVRFRGSEGAFMSSLDAVTKRIHQKLKQEFDPAGIFNRGRMFADL
jgi:glycolate oxidase FAD binding subunit